MNIDKLRDSYINNNAVHAICDHMASRTKNQNETTTHRILLHIEGENHDFRRADVIAAFRALEDAECGRYVEGRRGWPSRFVWGVKSLLVAGAATGGEDPAEVEIDEEPDIETTDDEMLEHTFWLRPELSVVLELPADLTASEANRLSQFVSSLSFEE
jgi:hypothetical protein